MAGVKLNHNPRGKAKVILQAFLLHNFLFFFLEISAWLY